MIRPVFLSLAAIFLLGTASSAQAADGYVLKELSDVIVEYRESRLGGKMFAAVETLLASASEKLQADGHSALASEIASDWVRVASINASQFGVLDLGDHAPLNEWLARTYDKIEAKLGPKLMRWLRYDDLKVFNFGIPVVFNPSGRRGESWGGEEYARHFVPFTGAVTYWSVLAGCRAIAPGLWIYACGTISEGPRFVMEAWIAPFISYRVFRVATGRTAAKSEVPMDLEALLSLGEQELSRRAHP